MMITLLRTHSDQADFVALVKRLDAELAVIDGADASFYAQYNKTNAIKQVVVAYEDGTPVACGAIKPYDAQSMEVKRMYVVPEGRNKGIATQLLNELEQWAKESCSRCVLETGKRQPDAIRLYQKNGYQVTPNYGQYIGMDNSVCFEKRLT